MDLADLRSFSKYHNKYNYLLNVIDIYSCHACSVPLKDKTANSITSAWNSLFQNRKPIKIQSEKGTEFVKATVQQYLKRQGVSFHTTHNPDIKDVFVERLNICLKKKTYKYFTKNDAYRHLDVMNKHLVIYKYAVHSTIGMTPSKFRHFLCMAKGEEPEGINSSGMCQVSSGRPCKEKLYKLCSFHSRYPSKQSEPVKHYTVWKRMISVWAKIP